MTTDVTTRELAGELNRTGTVATIGTHALTLGHALVAVDINGHPFILSALFDADGLSWSITDPATFTDHATGTLHDTTVEQAAAHLKGVLALHADPVPQASPTQSPKEMLLAALAAAGLPFEHWTAPGAPDEWLTVPTADGGEITVQDGTGRLPGNTDEYAGLRAKYAPVANEDFGDDEATVFESQRLGERTADGAARFAADLERLVLALTACRSVADARERWESYPTTGPGGATARYRRTVDGTTALRFRDTVTLSAEQLAEKLFQHYAVPWEQGEELPVELGLQELLNAVAFHVEQCAVGNHQWAQGVSADTEEAVRTWAVVQVQRRLPHLTWEQAD